MRHERCIARAALGLGRLLLLCSAAGAAAAEPGSGPRQALTVLDAVQLALAHNPTVELARAELTLAGGERLQAQGAFDPTLSIDVSMQYLQQELSDTRKQQLRDQRSDIQTLIDEVRAERGDTQTNLQAVIAAQANPEGIQLPDPDAQAQLDLYNTLIAGAATPAIRAELEAIRAAELASLRGELEARIAVLDQTDTEESERLRLLGDAPEVELSHDVVVGASYRQAYRNGWVLSGFSNLTIDGGNYKGKRKPTALGGLGRLDLYRSRVGVRLLVPLGRGQQTAAAAEGFAQRREQAAAALLAQQVRRSLFEVVSSYWDTSAAQATRDVLAESLRRQQRLAQLSEALIAADQLPRSERARIRARDADAAAQLAQAEQGLSSARLALSRAVGAPDGALSFQPVAADALPELRLPEALSPGERQQLVASSRVRRHDYQAALLSALGQALLSGAAREDTRSLHDLEIELAFTGVDEGPRIDQQLQGALLGSWTGPSTKLGYRYERPLRNDAAEGALQRQLAVEELATLQATTLQREIARSVVSTLDSLLASQQELAQQRLAVDAYRQAVAAERERLELGSATLIDLIQTEERLTASLLGAIGAQARAAQLLVALRFQAGLLAPTEGERMGLAQRSLVELQRSELLGGG